jgi:hypothetical protein
MSMIPLDISGKKVITQQLARRTGEKFFFTGKRCKEGHIANRYTSSGACVECRTTGRNKLYAGQHQNVLWMNRPVTFSAFNYPSPLEWDRLQQIIIDFAPTLFAGLKYQLGEPFMPRDKWPEDLTWMVIHNHFCFHIGEQRWWPMWLQGYLRDPQHNPRIVWDSDHGEGITWNGQRWMVENQPFILVGDELPDND